MSNIFININNDNAISSECFSLDYIRLQSLKILYLNPNSNIDFILQQFSKVYGDDAIDKKILKNFLDKQYKKNNGNYYLDDKQLDLYFQMKRFEKYYFNFLNLNEEFLNQVC